MITLRKSLAFPAVLLCLLTTAGAAPLRIVTSFYPVYIATLNVAKGVPGVEVVNLTPPLTGCLHDYQMRPDDLKKLSGASVFIVNGAGMESFLDEAISQSPELKIVNASEGIELVGDNPHVWVSVSLAMKQVENIARELSAIDPAHADLYRKNADAYLARLDALRKKMHEALKDAKTRDIVTFHEAFLYFAKEFDLNIVAVIEREPGSEPSARELARTIDIVRKSGATALFAEPQYPAKAIEVIAAETGATMYTLDPVVTGDDDPNAYLKIMEQNLEELQKALECGTTVPPRGAKSNFAPGRRE
jgi:zinc transport system substrate-binding protein